MSASKWRKNPEMHILGSHILYACVAVKQRELLAYLIRHFTTTHSVAEFTSLASALYLNDMDRNKWWGISYEFHINSILM